MGFFSFGKKKRTVRKSRGKKPPAAILKKCRKLKIKTMVRRGSKKVYKSVSVLKRLISKKKKLISKKKLKKSTRFGKKHRVSRRRTTGFGAEGYSFTNPGNYGYNQAVVQNSGILDQSSMIVNSSNIDTRPTIFPLDPNQKLPINGVYREFFGEKVPTQIPSNSIGFMGQPDGSMFALGSPFSAYSSFGKKRRVSRRRN